MAREILNELVIRIVSLFVIVLMIGSGMLSFIAPVAEGAPQSGGFINNNNVTANLTTIAPVTVFASDNNVGMVNISFNNVGGVNDTLEWLNVTVLNYTSIDTVSLWNETNGDGLFSTVSDQFMGLASVNLLSGDLGFVNLTNLNMGILNNTNMSVYLAFNVSSTATHGHMVNASVMQNNMFMTNAGQGVNISLYPSYNTMINNINVTSLITTVAPAFVKAGDKYVGMLNVSFFNNGGAPDLLKWLNVTVRNYTDVESVSIWNETDQDGVFSTTGDVMMDLTTPQLLSGDMGYANLTNLDMGIMRYTYMSIYIVFNITNSPTHGNLLNSSIMPYQINMMLAGSGGSSAYYPDYNTEVDTVVPTVVSITTTDPDGDGSVENATIVFSESILDSTIDVTSFSIGGIAANAFSTLSAADDNVIEISIASGVTGTDVKDVTYTFGAGDTTDYASNELASIASIDIDEIDGASPVITSAVTDDANANGKIDRYVLTFSENVTAYQDFYKEITVAGYIVDDESSYQSASNEVTVVLVEGTDFDTGAIPDITHPSGMGSLVDKAYAMPIDIATGDFNKDGYPDLATLDAGSEDMTIFVHDGDDGFGLRRSFPAGITRGNISIGDVNTDGFGDVVATNYDTGEVLVWLMNTSSWTFDPYVNYSSGNGALGVDIGDVNNDERNDVVVANFDDDQIAVFIQNSGGTLNSPAKYTTGNGPTDVVIADIARTETFGDVRYDVVVTNNLDNDISFFRQTTGGVLTAKTDIAVQNGPTGIAAGELNGDGWMDVVVANSDSDSITAIRQTGTTWTNPTLSSVSHFPVESSPTDIAVIDANNDGKNDVVVTNRGNDSVSFMIQGSGGAYSQGWKKDLNNMPYGLALDDFDSDGLFDAATAVPDGNYFTVIYQVPGEFSYDPRRDIYLGSNVRTYQPRHTDIGDINNDGFPDIVATSYNSVNRISVIYGDAEGAYKDTVHIATHLTAWYLPWDVKIGDLNNDGLNDVAITTFSNYRLGVFIQNVSGKLNDPVYYSTQSGSRRLDIGDINSDGLLDVVVTNQYSYTISVYTQNATTGNLNPQVTYATNAYYPWGVAIGDVNNDGKNDVVITKADWWNQYNVMGRFTQKSDGTLNAIQEYNYDGNRWIYLYDVEIADMNGDGRNDIISGRRDSSNLGIWYQNALNSFSIVTQYSTGVSNLYDFEVADITKDGKDDVIVVGYSSNLVSIMEQGSSSISVLDYYGVGTNPHGLAVDDLNKDGYMDIVTANYGGQSITILKQNPLTRSYSYSFFNDTQDYPRQMAKGDLNNDGYTDIVVINQNTRSISVFLNDKNGIYKTRVDYTSYNSDLWGLAVGDVNNDGRDDVVVSGWYYIATFIQKSDGTLSSYTYYNSYYYEYDVAIGDLNNDGRNDVAVASRNYVLVHWQSSTGSLSSYNMYYSGTNYHWGISIGDLNNDSLNDMISAAIDYDQVEYWTQRSSGGFNAYQTLSTGDRPRDTKVVDINNDSLDDIVVACEGGADDIYTFHQKSSGGFDIPIAYNTNDNPYGIDIVDFNGDGLPDVATADYSSKRVSIFTQRSDGYLNNKIDYNVATNPWDVAILNVDNDNALEIVTNDPNSDRISTLDPQMVIGTGSSMVNFELGVNGLKQVLTGDLVEQDGANPIYAQSITGNQTFGNSSAYDKILVRLSEDVNGSTVDLADFSISGVTINSAIETSPGNVELDLASDLSSDATPAVQLVGTIKDVNDLSVPLNSIAAIDGLRPRMTSAVTKDSDMDGHIEKYVLTFDENIFGSFDGTGFTVAGYSIDGAGSSRTGANEMTLALVESTGLDTGLTPDVTYAPGNMMDGTGNYLAATGSIVEEDGAAPAVASFYVYQIEENHPNLYAPDNTTLYYNNTPAGLSAPFTLRIEANDNGNLDKAMGEDAFGNVSVTDLTENTGGTGWEYDLTYEINQGEFKNPTLGVWVYDLDNNNASDSINLVLDNTEPDTAMSTDIGSNAYVAKFSLITLTPSDPAGIYRTYYQVDTSGWVQYSGPFSLSGFSNGEHTLYYYSIDNVNNTETSEVQPLYIAEDWTDGGNTSGTYSNMVIIGCNITVSGEMILENVTIIMNNTGWDNQWINVTSTGKLVIRNSTIRSVDPAFGSKIYVSGELDMFQTTVEDLWADPVTDMGGIYINTSTATIDKSTVSNADGAAISIIGASPTITDTTISDAYYGIAAVGGAPTLTNNDISIVTAGIVVVNNTGAMTLTGNDIHDAAEGIHGEDLFKVDSPFRITGNTFTDISYRAVNLDRSATASSSLSVDNNTLENVNGGIWVQNMDGPTVFISDNTVKNLTAYNIGIVSQNNDVTHIERNSFTNTKGDVIRVRQNSQKAYVRNNNVDGGTGTQWTHNVIGIYQSMGEIYIDQNDIRNVNDIDAIGTWENENNTEIYVRENYLKNNDYGGIWFWDYADTIYADNNYVGENSYGFWLDDIEEDANDARYIRNNEIVNMTDYSSWSAGISIENVNNISIENNQITNTEDNGIELAGTNKWGTVLLESNTVKDSGGNGISISGDPLDLGQSLKNTTLINNNNYGLYTTFDPGTWNIDDTTTFVQNGFYFSGFYVDMVVKDGGNFSATSSRFDWHDDITIEQGGTIYVYDTIFSGSGGYDFDVYGNLIARSSTIENQNKVYIEDPGTIDLAASTVRWGYNGGIHLKNANITLSNIYYDGNDGYGLFIEDSSPVITLSDFDDNEYGIIGDNFQGNITDNEIYDSWEDNIYLVDSSGVIFYNWIYDASENNIYLKNSDTTIKQNLIEDAGEYGIYLDNSDAHILLNDDRYYWRTTTWRTLGISNSWNDNIYVYYSSPHIENNTIDYGNKNGISLIYSGGHIEYNEIAWHTGSGIGTFADDNPSIHDNYMHDNGDSPPNRAPSATGGTITPSNPIYTSVLSITPVGWYDPDSDPPGFLYQWRVNVSGVWTNIVGATGANLNLQAFAIAGGDEVMCRLTPWDGKTTGPAVNSSTKIIGNSPPSITSVDISPSVAYDNSVLSAVPKGFSDPDGDTTQIYAYQWFNQSGAISGATSATLPPSNFKATDTIYCKVTPSDGQDNGPEVTSISVLIIHYTDPGKGVDDFDGDGVPDSQDAFPYNSTEWKDTDDDGIGDNSDTDIDGDGVNNTMDAFPKDKYETKDTDNDGVGDNADQDDDDDGYLDNRDAFPYNASEWRDTDDDGIGDNTDTDIDGDGVLNGPDAFPLDKSETKDTDSDGVGDNTDQDDDDDGYYDIIDAFPLDDTEHRDTDSDGIGDNTDLDDDGDNYLDTWEKLLGTDSKSAASKPLDTDIDGAPDGNTTNSEGWMDMDDDNDGYTDAQEIANSTDPKDASEYPGMPNRAPSITKASLSPTPAYDNGVISAVPEGFSDPDGDTTQVYYYQWYNQSGMIIGATKSFLTNSYFMANDTIYCMVTPSDGMDNGTTVKSTVALIIHYIDPGQGMQDADSDGVPDSQDAFPNNPTESKDTDGDGTGDNADSDDDGDGVPDTTDKFPKDKTETKDTDNDGIGDNADQDDDNDGVLDSQDAFPFDAGESKDSDGDGTGDNADTDRDGDGVENGLDDFPNNPDEWEDTDGDGFGDNLDPDDDGDGVYDILDEFPLDSSEWRDNDKDGTGDNADTDDDNDGYLDDWESYLGTDNKSHASQPKDTDDDGAPDGDATNSQAWMDTDDDGDGHTDAAEKAAGTDPKDAGSYPGAPNRAPSISKVSISPTTAYEISVLSASVEGFSDPDGDTTQKFFYTWYVNDKAVAGWTNSYLTPSNFNVGDTVYVMVTPSDGKDNGTAVKSNVALILETVGEEKELQDFDGDGHPDSQDEFPTDPDEWKDADGDGEGDNADNDRDGDKVNNTEDDFPNNPDEWEDSDGDGLGDNADDDNDNDGHPDGQDEFPDDPDEWKDSDGDGEGDVGDDLPFDFDNDGYDDINDDFPKNPSEWRDTDGDGTGDEEDADIDGDGVLNGVDKFPLDRNEYLDSDNDGIGDSTDLDDDNDGVPDYADDYPLDASKSDKSKEDSDNDGVPDSSDAFPDDPEKSSVTDTKEEAAAEEGFGTWALIGILVVFLVVILMIFLKLQKQMGAAETKSETPAERPGRKPPGGGPERSGGRPPAKNGAGRAAGPGTRVPRRKD